MVAASRARKQPGSNLPAAAAAAIGREIGSGGEDSRRGLAGGGSEGVVAHAERSEGIQAGAERAEVLVEHRRGGRRRWRWAAAGVNHSMSARGGCGRLAPPIESKFDREADSEDDEDGRFGDHSLAKPSRPMGRRRCRGASKP